MKLVEFVVMSTWTFTKSVQLTEYIKIRHCYGKSTIFEFQTSNAPSSCRFVRGARGIRWVCDRDKQLRTRIYTGTPSRTCSQI